MNRLSCSRLFGRGPIRADFIHRMGAVGVVDTLPVGQVDRLEELAWAGLDPTTVHPELVDFFERTVDWSLTCRACWHWMVLPLVALTSPLASWLGQLALPWSGTVEMASAIIPVDPEMDGRPRPRAWVRTDVRTGRTAHVMIYSILEQDGIPRQYVALPLPGANVTSLLRVEGTGDRITVTTRPRPGVAHREGLYLVTSWFCLPLPCGETITLTRSPAGLSARHEIECFGFLLGTMDYALTRCAGSSRAMSRSGECSAGGRGGRREPPSLKVAEGSGGLDSTPRDGGRTPAGPDERVPDRGKFRAALRALRDDRYQAISRIGIDLALWILIGCAANASGQLWMRVVAALTIGAIPLHDLLLQGHEGNHRMMSRIGWVNELGTWFTHAVIGLSHTAHRAFHLEHHRRAHTAADPEVQLLDRLVPGAPGWAYLLIPMRVHWAVNSWPVLHPSCHGSGLTVTRDLVGALALHAVVAWGLGATGYFWSLLLPISTGFPVAFAIRSICEHHHTRIGGRWISARTVETSRVVELLWSNVNHHLEHHLFPSVPCHQLPALRRMLGGRHVERESPVGRGYFRTAWWLVRQSEHFRQ